MTVLVPLTAALLVLTKLLDGWTTLRLIGCPRQETNPRARRWMERFGVRQTVWAVVVLALAIIATSTVAVAVIDRTWVDVSYVALGLAVAAIQGAVAHTNYTGRWNVVTRRVLLIHRGVGR